MKTLSRLLIFLAVLISLGLNRFGFAQEAKPKAVLVHYMPWYQSKDVSGSWGWHWTMNHFDPDKVDAAGRREIASHDYPLVGPYDSSDSDLLEYHVSLMKLSGIDGVIVDWYGRKDFRDYVMLHRNTSRLFEVLKLAGLKFAICYEDQSINHMIEAGLLEKSQDLAHAKSEFEWIARNWMTQETYFSVDDKPVMLVFGPLRFQSQQWKQLRGSLPAETTIWGLPHLYKAAKLDGPFGWPPVNGGKLSKPKDWKAYLHHLENQPQKISVAFPGFHDIYEQAQVHDSYGSLDARSGNTFRESFEMAMKSQSRVVQIATWNDFGEGTVIEPTVENEYRYLKEIQKRKSVAEFTPADLTLPAIVFEQRKQHQGNQSKLLLLDQASKHLLRGKIDKARETLEKLTR